MSQQEPFDLFVVGGGINGAGIARDAAGRGLSVALAEKDDLGEWTSSRSGKLIHGGLRYLEYYEFRLVRDALIEREVLLESAPHIIWPMRFVLPHSPGDRPAWLIRLGLFLYDHLGGRSRLPATRSIDLSSSVEGVGIKAQFTKAFEYSDCWVDDARLVLLNALDAHEKGAHVMTRTRFVSAERVGDVWQIQLQDTAGKHFFHEARALVNAAGPWVNHVIGTLSSRRNSQANETVAVESKRRVRLVKGSHIVVPKFWQGEHAYLLQNTDKRVIFVNPYEKESALVGTTDIPLEGEPESVSVEATEIEYLLQTINRYFETQLGSADVIHSFSGVRPLFDDDAQNPSAVTRDYVLELDGELGEAPLLSVFGGKITTFRKLAEQATARLQPWFSNMGTAWTATACLPGGDIPDADFNRFASDMQQRYSWLEPAVLQHLARLYGTRITEVLEGAAEKAHLGMQFSETFFEAEANYLVGHEWALSAEDILERRTKHHLHMTEQQIERFGSWYADRGIN